VSDGGAGGCRAGTRPSTPDAISLYAVQAAHRPLRLSLYPWASRGRTHHRLLLNWKGPTSAFSSPSPCGSPGRTTAPPVHIAVACPEPAPPPSAPVAPAFDGGDVGFLSAEELAEGGRGGGGRGSAGGSSRPGRGQGAVKRGRVKFRVGVRVVGPPRVVLEGR